MPISLTPPPPAPLRTMSQAAFDAAYAAFIAWQETSIDELNAMIAVINGTVGAGAIAIPYTFSTTTTDSDPGSGNLRLNQATQNTATVIRADLTGSDGIDKTPLLDLFDDATGPIKGYVRLVKVGDETKYLIFEVTALATPSGYRNITVAHRASSSASPFANSDAILLYFTRAGDLASTVGDHEVVVHSGNGHGSTNTQIRRYTTTLVNTGTAITYADSAANGATFTINEPGMYAMTMTDMMSSSATTFGISLNSTQLTTQIGSISAANRLVFVSGATSSIQSATITKRLQIGDVIRPHTGANLSNGTQPYESMFRICKVGQ